MEEEDHYTYLLLLLFAVSLVQPSEVRKEEKREREAGKEWCGTGSLVLYKKEGKINKEDLT